LKTTTRNPNNFGQSLKDKKSYEGQMLTMISIFSKTGELWFTYFDVYGKPLSSATSHRISLDQISKAKMLLVDQILKFGFDFFKTCKL